MKRYGILFALVVILLIVVIPVIMFINFYNGFKVLDNEVEAQLKQVDNILLQRHDRIPNLVNTVKGYAKHENDIFTSIADARGRMMQAGNVKEKSEASNALDSAISRLLVVTENYPQLKANEQFNRLMDELAGMENRLAVERKRYNDLVKQYNTKLDLFPGNIIAGLMGLTKKDYFEIAETAREAPQVNF